MPYKIKMSTPDYSSALSMTFPFDFSGLSAEQPFSNAAASRSTGSTGAVALVLNVDSASASPIHPDLSGRYRPGAAYAVGKMNGQNTMPQRTVPVNNPCLSNGLIPATRPHPISGTTLESLLSLERKRQAELLMNNPFGFLDLAAMQPFNAASILQVTAPIAGVEAWATASHCQPYMPYNRQHIWDEESEFRLKRDSVTMMAQEKLGQDNSARKLQFKEESARATLRNRDCQTHSDSPGIRISSPEQGIAQPENQKLPATRCGTAKISPVPSSTMQICGESSNNRPVSGTVDGAEEKIDQENVAWELQVNQMAADAVTTEDTVTDGRKGTEERTVKTQRKSNELKSVPTAVDETTKDAAIALFRLVSEEDTSKSCRIDEEESSKRQLGNHDWKDGRFVPPASPLRTISPSPDLKHSYPVPQALPDDFEPSGVDVIMGRGKAALKHSGNKRFRAIVAANMAAYNNTTYRADKSWLVNAIIDQVRACSTSGGFVEKNAKTGKWITVDDKVAQNKVKHALRDAFSAPTNVNPKPDHDKLHFLSYAVTMGDKEDVMSRPATSGPLPSRKRRAKPSNSLGKRAKLSSKRPKSTVDSPQGIPDSGRGHGSSQATALQIEQSTKASGPPKVTGESNIVDIEQFSDAKSDSENVPVPSTNRCVPVQEPMLSSSTPPEDTDNIPLPDCYQLMNFPQYVGKHSRNGKKFCVMCGHLRPSVRTRGVTTEEPVIPVTNRGVCTACDVREWKTSESNFVIKWCRRCRHFRHSTSFGVRAVCLCCRKNCREYIKSRKMLEHFERTCEMS